MARRITGRRRPMAGDDRNEPFEVFHRPQRSTAARMLGLALRMRAEITTAAALLLAWSWLAGWLRGWRGDRPPAPPDAPPPSWLALHWPGLVAGLLLALAAGVALAVPVTRRYLVRRALAVLTRHRLRQVCMERRIMNFTGNLPLFLWSRPTPVGERVWLLLRAGIDGTDMERSLGHIAAGCFARDARVVVARSVTALVLVDVIRRDPLAHPAGRPGLHLVPTRKGA
jgi:hypothetical protein